MIEWKGLFANTPYSSANNKTQDDAVVGMQDTIYVTGPGYGGYSANVRVHNASGTVVALIPVSGGGGALSAPAPVRILDDSTTYSYSLEVVRGAIPSNDADKIIIRIVGGASKRYPGQGSTLPDGSTSFAGPVQAPNLGAASGRWAQSIIPHRTLPYTAINNKGLQLTTGKSLLVRRPAPIKQSEGRVFGYKVVVENFDSAAVGNITLAKAATQVAQANLHGVGNGASVSITWEGSAGTDIPVAATFPGGTTAGDDGPGRSISDYIAHPDVARTDGGEYALYDFRFLAGASLYFGIRDNASIPTGVGPAECSDQFASSDRVTTWSEMTVNNGPDMCPMVWIIWYTSKGVIVADLFGDSVMGGSGTTAARRSIPALALTSLGIHCNVISHGGQIFPSTSQIIQSVAGTAIANGKIAVLRCASEVNDGANALLSWRWFLDAYEKLRSQGRLVLVMGPAPYDSPYVEQLCDLLDESGIPWFDQIPYLGTDFRHYKAGYSADQIHPNDVGADATWPAFAEWCRGQLLSVGF